jgi:prenyltransferase beta subunit
MFVIVSLGGLLLAASAAAAPNPANQASLDRTVRYLQEAQLPSGGFAAVGEPSQITSAWTTIALAAAGVNPQDQRRPEGVDAFSYLASNYGRGVAETECAPIACTTIFERELMVVNAAGADPHAFGGIDLVAQLLARARPDGSFPHVPGGQPGVNDTIFAVFGLVPISEPAAQAAIGPATDWIESLQHANGGWAWNPTSNRDEVDMTGAAIQALIAAGRGRNEAVEEGIAYLREAQNADGGFPEFPGNPESNVASTCWATQAIWAVGENPEGWRSDSGEATEEPLDYLESLQQPDGHIRWKRSQDLNGIWMTAYCSVALGGHTWPVPEAPRSEEPEDPPHPGQGEGGQTGRGVIAGGGGKGAPLFSRPKPQSQGRTPGGARVVRNQSKARNHSKTRRGSNGEQPTTSQTAEAKSTAEDAHAGEAVGSGRGRDSAASGEEVTGAVIGGGPLGRDRHFGAPGLHGAGVANDGEWTTAIAIGAAALLAALIGAGWERRREVLA